MLLEDLSGSSEFFIVDCLSKAGEHYFQVAGNPQDGFTAEFREGGWAEHFQATSHDMREIHEALTAWAFDLPGWREGLSWQRLKRPR